MVLISIIATTLSGPESIPQGIHLLMLANDSCWIVRVQSSTVVPLLRCLVLELRTVCANLQPVVLEEAKVGRIALLWLTVVSAVRSRVIVAVWVVGAEVARSLLDADGKVRHTGTLG